MSNEAFSQPFEKRFDAVRQHFEANGDPAEVLRDLRLLFWEVDLSDEPEFLIQALELLRSVTQQLDGDDLARHIGEPGQNIDDPQALFVLGYQLMECGLSDVAVSVLTRSNRLAPGQEAVIAELVAALEQQGMNREACDVLHAAQDVCDTSFSCRYLLAFNAVLSADLLLAREILPSLAGAEDPDEAFLAKRIDGMLQRAQLLEGICDLGPRDLRGWHFVTTGGILLHSSPHGFNEGMNGRYAYIADSAYLCRRGLERLRDALKAWDENPPWILAPPDRDSQILATAAEEILGLPVVEYTPDAGDGLVVAYDLSRISAQTPQEILFHSEGQLLYAHATCWTTPPLCVPDITTVLYQSITAPWDPPLKTDDSGQIETQAEAPRPVEELAARIVEATKGDEEDENEAHDPWGTAMEVLRAMGPNASFRNHTGDRRSPLWEGSPVKSRRFR